MFPVLKALGIDNGVVECGCISADELVSRCERHLEIDPGHRRVLSLKRVGEYARSLGTDVVWG